MQRIQCISHSLHGPHIPVLWVKSSKLLARVAYDPCTRVFLCGDQGLVPQKHVDKGHNFRCGSAGEVLHLQRRCTVKGARLSSGLGGMAVVCVALGLGGMAVVCVALGLGGMAVVCCGFGAR